MDDRSIVKLYMDRSEDAVKATSEKYGRYLTAIANRILRSPEDAEECVSDSYLKIWNAIPPADPPVFRAFIARITRNTALDRYDAVTAEKRGAGEPELCYDELAECLSSEGDYGSVEFAEILNSFLGGLSEENRRMFIRRYWYFDSIAELAEEFSCGESRVKTALFRMRKEFGEKLSEEGYEI